MKKKQKGCSFERLRLTKKQKETRTWFSEQKIGEMSLETLQVTVYAMHKEMAKVDKQLEKVFVHLQNAMP